MDRIKIAIVGLNFGKNIIAEILTGGASVFFQLAAICDIEKEKADIESSRLGVKAYYDIDSILLCNEIKIIGLFTGPVGRADLISKIIRAGKDVITTKPFEIDPVKAFEVLEEAKGLGRIIHMNSPSPAFSDELIQIIEWKDQYKLGQPVGCRCDVWVNYNEKADGSWYDDQDKCPAAPIFRLGIYLINDLVRLLGKAMKVQVLTSRIQTGRLTPDNAQLGILFENGAIANIFASFCINDRQFYKNSMIMNFQNGTIYTNVEPIEGPEFKGSSMTIVIPDNEKEKSVERKKYASYSGGYQWSNLYKAVSGQKLENEVASWEIAEGIKIIKAMSIAEKTCMTVNVE